MTTVIATEKAMAGDSRVTDDSTFFESKKVHRCKNGDLVGIAGSMTDALKFLEWYESGANKDSEPSFDDTNFNVMVVRKDGLFVFDDCLVPIRVDSGMFAIGSGRMAAMAAFHCGKSIRECVEIACKIDVFTGGTIVEMEYDPKPTAYRKKSKKS